MTKKVTLRKCIGCNEMKDKRELIRVIKTPEGQIVLDETCRKNGRGAYICKNPKCLDAAIKRKSLEKSFEMSIPTEISSLLEEEMKKLESR